MFGMGMGEIIIIAIVALLALGPDKLPEAAKKIGETIRGLRQQTTQLRKTIEDDTQLGDAMREIRSALNEDPTKPAKKPTAKTKQARRPAEGPPPEEAPPTETLVKPADDAVSRDADLDASVVASEAGDEAAGDANAGEIGDVPPMSDVAEISDVPESPNSPAAENGASILPRQLSDYEKYIHNNGTEAAAEKFGTSVEHAEAAMLASLER